MEDLLEDLLGRLSSRILGFTVDLSPNVLASCFHGKLIMSMPPGWSGPSAFSDKPSK
jgi:hypothetical protein